MIHTILKEKKNLAQKKHGKFALRYNSSELPVNGGKNPQKPYSLNSILQLQLSK